MRNWHNDLLEWATKVESEADFLYRACQLAQSLEFEWYCYHVKLPLPISNPVTTYASNYPKAWQRRYRAMDYVQLDPVVKKARLTPLPFLWKSTPLEQEPCFWKEAGDAGLNVGWTCSNICASSTFSMLTLALSEDPLTISELTDKELKMRWLADATHAALSRLFKPKELEVSRLRLTAREIEILRWTADGKTQYEISQILSVSFDTVKFHSKNAIAKLGTTNKTAAVARAAVLGVLG